MTCAAPEEMAVLREFRRRIADLTLNEVEEHEIWALSWLRARDLNVDKAEDMIRKCFAWRKVNNIGTLLASWNPPEDYSSRYPYEICGYDIDDNPVVITPFGNWDVRKAVDAGDAKVWLRYNQVLSLIVIEDAKKKMRETKKYISQFVGIFDLKGFSIRQLTSRACIEALMESVRQYEDNYPETLRAAYVVNAPRIFAILFNIVKPLLSARTLSKVSIYDSNSAKWKPVLLNNIPADQLPIQYGGTKKSKLTLELELGELSLEDDDLKEAVVEAGGQLNLDYIVDVPNSTISWKFKTDNFDIGFSLKENGVEIVPYERVDACKSIHEGMYLATKTGKYTIVFDNKYSRIRCKTLLYIVKIIKP